MRKLNDTLKYVHIADQHNYLNYKKNFSLFSIKYDELTINNFYNTVKALLSIFLL